MSDPGEWLSASEVARVLGISAERVRQLAKTKFPPDHETPLGALWEPETVERFRLEREADPAVIRAREIRQEMRES